MDILQETALAIIGFAGGVSVAAGTFALITALGIIPRLASRMGVAEHVYKAKYLEDEMLACAQISADLDMRMQNVRDVISKNVPKEEKIPFLGEMI